MIHIIYNLLLYVYESDELEVADVVVNILCSMFQVYRNINKYVTILYRYIIFVCFFIIYMYMYTVYIYTQL